MKDLSSLSFLLWILLASSSDFSITCWLPAKPEIQSQVSDNIHPPNIFFISLYKCTSKLKYARITLHVNDIKSVISFLKNRKTNLFFIFNEQLRTNLIESPKTYKLISFVLAIFPRLNFVKDAIFVQDLMLL